MDIKGQRARDDRQIAHPQAAVPWSLDAVTGWLVRNVAALVPPLRFEQLAGGRSNMTFLVRDANDRRLILRRPPDGLATGSAHNIVREQRIIAALAGSGVPVPAILGVSSTGDSDVAVAVAGQAGTTDRAGEVTGVPFVVMEFVDGVVPQRPDRPAIWRDWDPPARRRAAEDLIDALARLHRLDVDTAGIGGIGPRDAFVQRQLRRFTRAWDAVATRDLPAITEAARSLGQHVPPQQSVSIVHGDYRFGNCIFDPVSGKLRAVLDWELCSLGDPLADLGYLRAWWADPQGPPSVGYDATGAGGFPTFDSLLGRYRDATGFDVSRLGYYTALAWWRLAVINEGVLARLLRSPGPDGDDTGPERLDLQRLAAATVRRAEIALQYAREAAVDH